jgi:hypothetical protein
MMTIDPWLKIGADQDLRIDIIQLTQIDWSCSICFLSNKIDCEMFKFKAVINLPDKW